MWVFLDTYLNTIFKTVWNRNTQRHSFTQPIVSPEPSIHHPCFSLNTSCTIITVSSVQVFLQKESKRERKHLKSNFRDTFLTLRMSRYLSNCQVRLNTHEELICCGFLAGARSRNLSQSLLMSRLYLSEHVGPLLFTFQHVLLQSHWVTSCALNTKLPSCLHPGPHSWVPPRLSLPWWSSLAFQVQLQCMGLTEPSQTPS